MSLTSATYVRPASWIITPWSPQSIGIELTNSATGGTGGGGTWPFGANAAVYVPFRLLRPFTVRKVFTINSTAVAGSWDIGVYDAASTPNRLFNSGSVTQAGTSVLQESDVTDYVLPPGDYYMALAVSSASATFARSNGVLALWRACGCAQQASAFTLPSTATFASWAQSYLPHFGLSSRTLVA